MSSHAPADHATMARPPFELHNANVEHRDDGGSPMRVAKSPQRAPAALHRPATREDENGCSDGSPRLSPIRLAASETADPMSPGTPEGGRKDGAVSTSPMDASFPDNGEDIEIGGEEEGGEEEGGEGEDETEEERQEREMEESEALARQLMAEEAVASYALGTEFLRDNADQFSAEDFAALQAALAEEDPGTDPRFHSDGAINPNDVLLPDDASDDPDASRELSYDALLRLGERLGDVRSERWARVATARIAEHCGPESTFAFAPGMAAGKAENHTEVKCQVCQYAYAAGERLRRLPCGHCFHVECIDAWLGTKDACALCRRSIVTGDA